MSAACAASAESPDEFFEKNVRPVLVDQCYKCHSADAKKLKGGLRVDSRDLILKGGDSGPVIVPGDPDKSLLVKAIHRVDEDTAMPPKEALPQKDVDALTQWVKMGAPWPGGDKPVAAAEDEAAKKHWAFQPVKKPAIPQVKNSAWVKSPLDAIVLAKLEQKKLTPSPMADKRTLIRRATFDLIGLPPTAEEIDAFEKDTSPDAFAKVVDRLLASPRYGERWARHWLDVARYADHKGYLAGGEERRYPFAYTYRDWVIHAFNSDMPYDKFLELQIAADKIVTGDDKRDLAALGFLTVGRRFLNNQNDIIDDRIDVTMRGTQALTVGCARCHNHKFDPIPTADYYSLYGVFASSEEPKELPVIDELPKTPEAEAWQKEYDARVKELEDFKNAHPDWKKNRQFGDQVRKLDVKVQEWNMQPNAPPRAMVLVDREKPVQPHIFLRGNPQSPGPVVPRQFLEILSGSSRKPFTNGSGRLELAQAIANKNNPLTARVFVNRVWLQHFGKPLVRTPSDFGVRTEPPANPELLDFLAAQFMEEGWSIKKLHRTILLSATYQQSSEENEKNRAIDPDNNFVWRQNRQRLDFEAMRDSLLAVAGQLDTTMGGPSVPLFGKEIEIKGETVKPRDTEAAAKIFSKRRSVYAFIDRQNLPGAFRTFDFASPDAHSPMRFTTTVPQQALFMLNSPFVIEQAKALASRASAPSDEERVKCFYRVAFGRAPTHDEISAAIHFVHAAQTADNPAPPTWQYGWGTFDENAKRVSFTALKFFAEKKAWQAAKDLPDAQLGFINLQKNGGHPGRDAQHAVIRRWRAPRDGEFAIHGTLVHPSQNGDGVRGRIVHTTAGTATPLGEWISKYDQVSTLIERVAVKRGDTIDFIVDCRGDDSFDSFSWAPIIRALAPPPKTEAPQIAEKNGMEWSAAVDFAGPTAPAPPPLSPWEKYAQVLLATNEFVFVD